MPPRPTRCSSTSGTRLRCGHCAPNAPRPSSTPTHNVFGDFGDAMALYFGGDMNAALALTGQVCGRIDEAEWCGPCRQFGPVFEAAAEQHSDVVFGKVDADAQQELAGHFGIRSIPTLMAIRDKVVLFSQPGALPAHALEDLIGQIKEIDMDDVRRQIAEEQATGTTESS
jgi:thioredoxin 1